MHKEHSAGGVIVSDSGAIVVVRQGTTSWSLPKGHVEPGETARQAALREIREESGLRQLTFVKRLGSYDRYKIGLDGHTEDTSHSKTIELFLYTSPQVDLQPEDPHNPEARWVSLSEAIELLTHPRDKAFLREHQAEIQALTIDNKFN